MCCLIFSSKFYWDLSCAISDRNYHDQNHFIRFNCACTVSGVNFSNLLSIAGHQWSWGAEKFGRCTGQKVRNSRVNFKVSNFLSPTLFCYCFEIGWCCLWPMVCVLSHFSVTINTYTVFAWHNTEQRHSWHFTYARADGIAARPCCIDCWLLRRSKRCAKRMATQSHRFWLGFQSQWCN